MPAPSPAPWLNALGGASAPPEDWADRLKKRLTPQGLIMYGQSNWMPVAPQYDQPSRVHDPNAPEFYYRPFQIEEGDPQHDAILGAGMNKMGRNRLLD